MTLFDPRIAEEFGTECEWCDEPGGRHLNGCRLGLGPDEIEMQAFPGEWTI